MECQKIKIIPKTKYLNAKELLTQRQNELKNNQPASSLDDLLHKRRMEPKKTMAYAIYDEAAGTICLMRKPAYALNMQHYGYHQQDKHYLHYYEALHALQLGRLHLHYHDMPVSLEQAYVLLLGEQRSIKYDTLLVYSYLSRHGFVLKAHRNINYALPAGSYNMADCCWEIAMCNYNNKCIPDSVQQSASYKAALASQQLTQQQSNSCLDCFTSLQQLLANLQYIQLSACSTNAAALDITFDMFLKDAAYVNMSMKPPILRVLILASDALFPAHDDISVAFEQQLYKTPILLLQVAAGKQMQCFLYRIS